MICIELLAARLPSLRSDCFPDGLYLLWARQDDPHCLQRWHVKVVSLLCWLSSCYRLCFTPMVGTGLAIVLSVAFDPLYINHYLFMLYCFAAWAHHAMPGKESLSTTFHGRWCLAIRPRNLYYPANIQHIKMKSCDDMMLLSHLQKKSVNIFTFQ